jgi:hypothetical protein
MFCQAMARSSAYNDIMWKKTREKIIEQQNFETKDKVLQGRGKNMYRISFK